MASRRDTPVDVLAHDLAAEAASALGRAGRRLEAAIEAYEAAGDPAERRRRLAHVAEATWELSVQREAMGLRDMRTLMSAYRIPPAALALAGVRSGRS